MGGGVMSMDAKRVTEAVEALTTTNWLGPSAEEVAAYLGLASAREAAEALAALVLAGRLVALADPVLGVRYRRAICGKGSVRER